MLRSQIKSAKLHACANRCVLLVCRVADDQLYPQTTSEKMHFNTVELDLLVEEVWQEVKKVFKYSTNKSSGGLLDAALPTWRSCDSPDAFGNLNCEK